MLIGALLSVVLLTGCRAFFHGSSTTQERLSAFPTEVMPLKKPVNVYWDKHQVPFIEAEDDLDLAFVMGVVHHHLRAGQLALIKRISQGRLSEMAGPLTVEIDHALRILDFGYAAPEILANMPEQTKAWLTAFVDGLNWHRVRSKRPAESGLLNLDDEPYTLEDIVTISRLAGADVNWGTMLTLLNERENPNYEHIFATFLERGQHSTASYHVEPDLQRLTDVLTKLNKSGSNSFAVAGSRTENGAALLANDPHLGQFVPNFWILLGYRSPSYHAVGFAVPGLPFLGLGRNTHISWGGTNMQGASSDLYDVSHLDENGVTEHEETIKVRFGRDRKITVRRSAWGPIFSDAPVVPAKQGERLALRWVGHEVSDEFTAFLKANQAKTIESFREAFAEYSVSGQNLLVAEDSGRIGHIPAIRLPLRPFNQLPSLILQANNPDHQWQGLVSANQLPYALNPETGFIASANNRPVATQPPFGFFFGPSTRIDRLQHLLEIDDQISFEDANRILRDVYDANAHRISKTWTSLLKEAGVPNPEFENWDGQYLASSKAALQFETFTEALASRYFELQDMQGVQTRNWTFIKQKLVPGVQSMASDARKSLLTEARREGQKNAEKFKDWGDMHRLRAQHPLGNIPVLGRKFRFGDIPIDGSRQTLLKTAHGLVSKQHTSNFGSQSRHISMMHDIDENYFILLGGNDGWLGSENMTDQLDLWLKGGYIRFPLRLENIKKAFPTHMKLIPK
jgi:penicillin amidase